MNLDQSPPCFSIGKEKRISVKDRRDKDFMNVGPGSYTPIKGAATPKFTMGARVKSFGALEASNAEFPDPTKYEAPKVNIYRNSAPAFKFGSGQRSQATLPKVSSTPGP